MSSFGAHAINCTYHPYGDMPLSETEAKVSAEVGDFSAYNQHMDSHLGIQTHKLSEYITKLESNNYKHLKQQWQQDYKTYYSVMSEACPGFFVEFISTSDENLNTQDFTLVEETRVDFSLVSDDNSSEDKVVKVSRATTKIEEMIEFYTKTVEGELVSKITEKDGSVRAIVKLNHAEAQLQFVNRPASTDSKFTVADLEQYVNSVHDKYIKSTNCGFDQYADMHWAYDSRSYGETLSSISKKLEEGGHKYRWFGIPGGIYQIYAFDPSGWTFQLDLMSGDDVPSKTATYSAACKSDDGCYGQGLCDDVAEGHFYYATKTWEYFLN